MHELFSRLNARRYDTLGELLTVDAIFDVAYFPRDGTISNPTVGRDAVQGVFENVVARMFDPFEFEVLETYLGEDPEVVAVEYVSRGVATPTGRPYANRYVSLMRIRAGQIAFWREYHNPEKMTEAFSDPPDVRTVREGGAGQ